MYEYTVPKQCRVWMYAWVNSAKCLLKPSLSFILESQHQVHCSKNNSESPNKDRAGAEATVYVWLLSQKPDIPYTAASASVMTSSRFLCRDSHSFWDSVTLVGNFLSLDSVNSSGFYAGSISKVWVWQPCSTSINGWSSLIIFFPGFYAGLILLLFQIGRSLFRSIQNCIYRANGTDLVCQIWPIF